MTLFSRNRQDQPGFLKRLARNKAGNTLALMAAAIIPLCGLVGGGVDLARMYIAKTRLQHACDAGALAGRKQMGGGTWTQDSGAPNASAIQFFNGNFADGSYGSSAKSVSFTENAGKVTGAASVLLPMTIMQIFGYQNDTIAVTCSAEMRLPNTDVMFVLDTTGSMDDPAKPGDPTSKIDGLKVAVKCFYEIVARLDTDATCDGGAPSGGTGSQVQIRFGFVPYAVNVNMKGVLDGHSDWMVDKWSYQSRQYIAPPGPGNPWSAWAIYTNQYTRKYYGIYYVPCSSVPKNSGYAQYSVVSTAGSYCQTQYRYKTVTWHYGLVPQTVSGLKNGAGFNDSITLQIGTGGANQTVNWDGCIEERKSDTATLTSEKSKIDALPTDDNTRWAPLLKDMIFTRQTTISMPLDMSQWDTTDLPASTADYGNTTYYQCPKTPAVKLRQWPDANAFDAYVDSLFADGNTHHDIGLLWGARLISPTGIFSGENAYTPQGGEIQRNVIFMTDGVANSQPYDYSAYGVPWFDKRQSSKDNPQPDDLNPIVNARMLSICSEIKNMKNTTLWVISYGNGVDQDTKDRLATCATTGRFFDASDSATLQQTFRKIANEISQLRLTK